MRPGDQMMSTEAGNFVHVTSSGILDEGANPVTRRIYVPILNQIKDFCENYLLNTAGGVLKWVNRRDNTPSAEGSETEVVWQIKEFSEGRVVMEAREGSVQGVTDTVAKPLYHRDIRKLGEVIARVTLDVDGNMLLQGAQADLSFTGDFRMAVGGEFRVEAEGDVVLKGAMVKLANAIEPAVLGQTLVSTLKTYGQGVDTYIAALNTILTAVGTAIAALDAGVTTAAINTTLVPAANALPSLHAAFDAILAADTELS
jgi:hypothetical protein